MSVFRVFIIAFFVVLSCKPSKQRDTSLSLTDSLKYAILEFKEASFLFKGTKASSLSALEIKKTTELLKKAVEDYNKTEPKSEYQILPLNTYKFTMGCICKR